MKRVIQAIALVVLAFAIVSTPAVAQVPQGPLSIHVEATLGETTTVGNRAVTTLSGMAILAGLINGEVVCDPFSSVGVGVTAPPPEPVFVNLLLSGAALANPANLVCTGFVDREGIGSGRCASSGGFEGAGTWAGRIGTEARTLVHDIHLQVVCQSCVRR